jgi:hypothetical protein
MVPPMTNTEKPTRSLQGTAQPLARAREKAINGTANTIDEEMIPKGRFMSCPRISSLRPENGEEPLPCIEPRRMKMEVQ